METKLTLKDGILDGLPIFIGYFTTAIAFGLMSTTLSFTLFETWLTSFFVYAGSSQFLLLSLIRSGASVASVVISVFFINSRYIFMASSLSQRLPSKSIRGRLFAGFHTTDEVFSVASFKGESISWPYLIGLGLTSWTGWWSGSIVGASVGDFLPDVIKRAAVITVYAMFASILGGESRRNVKALVVFLISAVINSVMILGFNLSAGLSIVVSMLSATVAASFIYTDEEAGME